MTLSLPLGGIADSDVRRAFEQIALQWPVDDLVHQVGAAGEPAFANAWVNVGGAVSVASFYRKGERVYLDGGIKTGTIGLAAFTLPVGYRPAGENDFAVASAGAFGRLVVDSAGVVTPQNGSNVTFFLSGVSFRVV